MEVLIDTYRCLMQNYLAMTTTRHKKGLNRYISLLNAEPKHSHRSNGGDGLNRYISLLNAEPIAAAMAAGALCVLIDTYRCLMQNLPYLTT